MATLGLKEMGMEVGTISLDMTPKSKHFKSNNKKFLEKINVQKIIYCSKNMKSQFSFDLQRPLVNVN